MFETIKRWFKGKPKPRIIAKVIKTQYNESSHAPLIIYTIKIDEKFYHLTDYEYEKPIYEVGDLVEVGSYHGGAYRSSHLEKPIHSSTSTKIGEEE